jgi:predicted nicotinamide N-methyase
LNSTIELNELEDRIEARELVWS